MAKVVTRSKLFSNTREDWVVPDITWVNGVPCCGKTTWVVKHFEMRRDVVITTTREAANDLREKLASRLGTDAVIIFRMMVSVHQDRLFTKMAFGGRRDAIN
ncbi:hypothetical protein EVAR_49134_1 [Eumeta japonica]|uniref:(+)RNA virus helicase C-terminal domain-containing protein n=1 Tax=Eumeta variegata TaxID=151549 RepID=A0A4C1YR82_EUMVA|nr:hypothetical protein EVAR_49134_1 [Eumeta japonica]